MRPPEVRRFGVRHHDPGVGRALREVLDAWEPDVVLVEGPVEATPLLAWVGHEALVPPVALVASARAGPQVRVSIPFLSWSPEWIALRWAVARGVAAAFVDLPLAHRLALEEARPPGSEGLDVLAAVAGFPDPDAWWDDLVGRPGDPGSLFVAIEEAMAALRAAERRDDGGVSVEARREAAMRRAIREALAAGGRRIAVVCGAWHVPALAALDGAARDDALCAGLPEVAIAIAWEPWSEAEVPGRTCPEWSACVAAHGAEAPLRWAARWAAAIRRVGGRVGIADVSDTVVLAERIAAVRGRSRPGWAEVDEAVASLFPPGVVAQASREVAGTPAVGAVPPEAPRIRPLSGEVGPSRLR